MPALGTSTAHGQRPERARRALLVGSVAVAMAAVLTTAWVLYPVNRGPQADSSPPAELAAAQFSDRIDASPGAQLYAGAPRGKTPAETAVATDDEPSEVSSEPYAGAPRGETPAETAAATDDEPSEISSEAAATPVTSPVGHTLYIANTGGVGVRLRTECADPSVRAGALVEGATVRVVREGLDSSCADWTLVQASGAGATWVRDRYLGATRPSPEPATISVISYEDYWVPVLELRIQKAWSADLTTNKGRTFRVGCLQDHWRAVGDTVITYGGAVIRDPAPAGCGFGPLEEVEQLSVPAR